MIVAFSTSSPLASVALLTPEGEVIASGAEESRMNASGACLRILSRLLAETGRSKSEATLFLADLGPGSFTGVKVAVTLAKTMAMALGTQTGGISAFDLISPTGEVVLPCKRGEFFVRSSDGVVNVVTELPVEPLGYGPGVEPAVYPLAERFSAVLGRIVSVAPEVLVPEYLVEPAISTPNKPYREVHV